MRLFTVIHGVCEKRKNTSSLVVSVHVQHDGLATLPSIERVFLFVFETPEFQRVRRIRALLKEITSATRESLAI